MNMYRQHSFFDDVPEDSTDVEPLRDEASAVAEDFEAEVPEDSQEISGSDTEAPDDVASLGDEPSECDDIPADDAMDSDSPEAQCPEPEADEAQQTDAAALMVDPGQSAVDTFFGPPRLERPRPVRPPLIPRWAPFAAAGVVALVVFAFGFAWWSSSQASIQTPKIVGVDVAVATTRLAEQGLQIAVSDKHFSPTPAGTVLSQTPAVDTKLRRGDTVTVIVSAGTEQFSMPDVVGNGLLLAQGILQTKGLDVRVERQPSQQPSDTVLSSNPAAGAAVHTGDIVRLSVAAAGPSTAILLPYDMTGVTVLLDPAPVNDALTDVPLDIARRVRSLIEASRGTVVTTRALADASALVEPPARAQKAAASSATVSVGLSTLTVGGAGLLVFTPSPILPHASSSAKLASLVASDLASGGTAVHTSTLTSDSVLAAAGSPWTRVQLGSLSQRDDVAKFTDPAWEDAVARGIYKAVAALYGRKTSGQ